MDKYPKTDLEFEALFESVYRRKVDASQLHELQTPSQSWDIHLCPSF